MELRSSRGRRAASRLLLAILLLGGWARRGAAQAAPSGSACALALAGRISDQRTGEPLPGALLRLVETRAADPDGHYHFHLLCAGSYYLRVSFVGYTEQVLVVDVRRNTILDIRLRADHQQLGEVHVEGARETRPLVSQSQTTLSGQALQVTRGLSLGESLKGITGVYSIQTGPTFSKPVIHGLYGNRVLILNNGVRQEG